MNKPEQLSEEEALKASQQMALVEKSLQQVLFGQDNLIHLSLVCLLSGGNVLLEGLPGLGKTELVKGFSRILKMETRRIQFTPDLLPGDITGNPILQERQSQREFVFQPGPVFANLLLADEINRASPKTQSALLEAMQEKRVTVMGQTYVLPEPFFVMATQNPIELEGTYPLPEAQLDRFLFKLEVSRGGVDMLEKIVTHREMGREIPLDPVMDRDEFLSLMRLTRRIYMPPLVARYIARLVEATHPGTPLTASVRFGASPRAALALAAASKSRALLQGRINASFEDVQAVALPVLAHRTILDYSAKMEGITSISVVRSILEAILPQDRDLPRSLQEAKI